MVTFRGITVYYLATFKRKKKEEENKLLGTTKTLGGVYLGGQTLRSGLPRALGVRLESHTTTKKNARNIFKSGGYLDPNYGGTGASNSIDKYTNVSKNYVHTTGIAPDDTRLPKALHPLYRKFQRGFYKGMQGNEKIAKASKKDVFKAVLPYMLGRPNFKSKVLYVGGSDKYFNSAFVPDPDDIAIKTRQKVKVSGNRLGATVEAIKREGLGNLIKNNPSRVLSGLGILGVGGYGSYKLLNRKTRSDKGKTRGAYKK